MKRHLKTIWAVILTLCILMTGIPIGSLTGQGGAQAAILLQDNEAEITSPVRTKEDGNPEMPDQAMTEEQAETAEVMAAALRASEGEAQTDGDYLYRLLEDGTAAIVRYTGSAENVRLPLTIGGADVTAIDEGAFASPVRSVAVHGNVLYIAANAFAEETVLQTWQGSYAAAWGQQNGYRVQSRSAGTLNDGYLDLSDVTDRLTVLSETTIATGTTEARRLSVGSTFLTGTGDDEAFYTVTGKRTVGKRVYLTVQEASALEVYQHRIYEGTKTSSHTFSDTFETGVNMEETEVSAASVIYENHAKTDEKSFAFPSGFSLKDLFAKKGTSLSVAVTYTVKQTTAYRLEIENGEIQSGTMVTDQTSTVTESVTYSYKDKVSTAGGILNGTEEEKRAALNRLLKAGGKQEDEKLGYWFVELVPSIDLGIEICPFVSLEVGGSGTLTATNRVRIDYEYVPSEHDWGKKREENLGEPKWQLDGVVYGKFSAGISFKIKFLHSISALSLSAKYSYKVSVSVPLSTLLSQCIIVASSQAVEVELEVGLWFGLGNWEIHPASAGKLTVTLFKLAGDILHWSIQQGFHTAAQCLNSSVPYSFRFETDGRWQPESFCYLKDDTYTYHLAPMEWFSLDLENMFKNISIDAKDIQEDRTIIIQDFDNCLDWTPELPQRDEKFCKWELIEPRPVAEKMPYYWITKTKDGKKTVAWNLEEALGKPVEKAEDLPQSITLRAVWDDRFAITFDANGGKFTSANGTQTETRVVYYSEGEAPEALDAVPEKNMAVFDKWTTDEAGLEDWAMGEITEDLHLYAQYISFDPTDHSSINAHWGAARSIIGEYEHPMQEHAIVDWKLHYERHDLSDNELNSILTMGINNYLNSTKYQSDKEQYGDLIYSNDLKYCKGKTTTLDGEIIGISLTGWEGTKTEDSFVVPSTLNGKPITGESGFFRSLKAKTVLFAPRSEAAGMEAGYASIPDEAFVDNDTIEYVDMGLLDVYRVGESAFLSCPNLKGVVLPGTVTEIGAYAFANCTGLIGEANLGNQITKIEHEAFFNCMGLQKVIINTPYMTTMKQAFTNGLDRPAHINLVLGDKVFNIPYQAFVGCSAIKEITVADQPHLTTIGEEAFSNCSGLDTVTLQPKKGKSRLTKICSKAFANDSSLKVMDIPSSVVTYDYYKESTYLNDTRYFDKYNIFVNTPIEKLTIGGQIDTIPMRMLYEIRGTLKELVLRDGVKKIGNNAFYGSDATTRFEFTALEKVTLPESLEEIGSEAFRNATALTSMGVNSVEEDVIRFPGKIKTISNYSFAGCSSIRKIEIPSNIATIGQCAFRGCSQLNTVVLAEGLERIEYGAFSYDTNLTEIAFPSTLMTYNNSPTNYNTSDYKMFAHTPIKKITIGGDMEIITAEFSELTGTLEEVVIRNGTKHIGLCAFGSSSESSEGKFQKLKKVTLPASLETIGNYAFAGASALTDMGFYPDGESGIRFPDSLVSIGYYAFSGCSSMTELYVPSSVKELGAYSFSSCSRLKTVLLSEGLENIQYRAFSGDGSLTEISIPASVITYDYCGNHEYLNSRKYFDRFNIFVNTPIRKLTIGGKIDSIKSFMFYEIRETLEELVLRNGIREIGNNAFYGNYNNSQYRFTALKKVTLPDSLEIIGMEAFREASALYSMGMEPVEEGVIRFPGKLQSIQYNSFYGCSAMRRIEVPPNVKTIDGCAFSRCGLTSALLSEGLETICYGAFSYTNLTEIVIPKSVTTYQTSWTGRESSDYNTYNVFGHTPIRKLTIGGNLETIGSWFYDIAGTLEELVIRDGTKQLGQSAFGYYSEYYPEYTREFRNLRKVTLPDSLETINQYVFAGASSLQEVYTGSALSSIGNKAFNKASGLVFYRKPNTEVNTWLANWCTTNGFTYSAQLSTVSVSFDVNYEQEVVGTSVSDMTLEPFSLIPEPETPEREGYVFLGWFAPDREDPWDFATDLIGASDLTLTARWLEISVNGLYEDAGDHAILLSYALSDEDSTVVTLPPTWNGLPVTEIAEDAFLGEPITRLTLPAYVTNLSAVTFIGAENLTWIEVPKNAENYSSRGGILYSKDGSELICSPAAAWITTFAVPEGVTGIGDYAFLNQEHLQTLTLNEGLEEIGGYAFYGCDALAELILPDSLLTIGNSAFAACYVLMKVQGGAGLTRIGNNAFRGSSFCVFYGADESALIRYAVSNGRFYNLYKVSWLLDGTEVNNRTVQAGELIPELTVIMEENRVLRDGWFRDEERNTSWQFDTDRMPAGDLTLYAVTIPMFDTTEWTTTVGEETLTGVKISGYNDTTTEIRIPGTLNGERVLTFDPSVFPAGSILHLPGTLAEIDATALNGFTLYAPAGSETARLIAEAGLTAQAENHLLSFQSNGGQMKDSRTLQAGTEITLPETVRDEMTFTGWYLNESLTEPAGNAGDTFVMPDADTILYAAWGGTPPVYDFQWEQQGQEIVITGSGNAATVVIPETINGLPVTQIADRAFRKDTVLQSLTLPEGLRSIGEYAFFGSGLQSLELPAGMTRIGDYAFAFCTDLESANWPASVTEMSEGSFMGDLWLRDPDLPEGLTRIGADAMNGCAAIRELVLPDSVTALDSGALRDMTGLKTLTLGAGMRTISSTALDGCDALTAIHVSANNTAYLSENGVLYSDDQAILVRYPAGKNQDVYSVSANTFQISAHAFEGAQLLRQIELPAGLEVMEAEAFRGSGLTAVDLSEITGLTVVPEGAFRECRFLEEVQLPATLLRIGANAFLSCWNLTEVDIPDTVTFIGDNAFWAGTTLIGCAGGAAQEYTARADQAFRIRNAALIPAQELSVSKTELTLMKGIGYTLTASASPADTTDTVSWYSEDPDVLRVDDGVIRPLKTGETRIVVYAGEAEKTIPVEVVEGDPYTILPASGIVYAGEPLQLSAVARTDNVPLQSSVFWFCDSDAGSVDENGLITATGNGTAEVRAHFSDGISLTGHFAFVNPAQAMHIAGNIRQIEAEAFSGLTALRCVIFDKDSTASIGDNAFANCENLSIVYIPAGVTQFGDDVFIDSDAAVILCESGSAAAEYAETNGLTFFLMQP